MEKVQEKVFREGGHKHISYWLASVGRTNYPSLTEDLKADVAIIGGGIAGIMTAFFLGRSGFDVVLMEKDRILQGVTGNTTAKITAFHGPVYSSLVSAFGERKTQLYARSNQEAIDSLEALSTEEGIRCDFERKDFVIYARTDEGLKTLNSEMNALRKAKVSFDFSKEIDLPLKVKGSFRIENQAQFHPTKFLIEIAKRFVKEGGRIFENTQAVGLSEGALIKIKTAKFGVTAKHAVIATNFPFYDRPGFYFARLYPSTSYAVAVRVAEKFPDSMFMGVDKKFMTFRSQGSGRGELVIVGGQGHHTGKEETSRRYQDLLNEAEQVFQVKSLDYYWSTHDAVSLDNAPYIGRITKEKRNLFVSTGFGKWGMTKGVLSGMILSDLIQGRGNPWAQLYAPSRFKLSSAKRFVAQNVGVAKMFSGARLRKYPALSSIKKGEGAIVEVDNNKVAVFKDDAGKIYALSPYCTHMGCVVSWNAAEKSWDCPCHGSRFDIEGRVLHSPAIYPLPKVKVKSS